MRCLKFLGIETATAESLRAGGPDANGQPAHHMTSDGGGNPCRHCLTNIAGGEDMLVVGHRPFPAPQPYAELGPIFLHARACERYEAGGEAPEVRWNSPSYIVRGYGHNDWIVYGTGEVTPSEDIPARAADLLARDDIAYVDVRSAQNNCFQYRIERA